MKSSALRFALLFAVAGAWVSRASATTYLYSGDTLPTVGAYAPLYTTLGPGHPTGSYFTGTTWSSDGDLLTMNTTAGQGIWFGRTGGYGDPSNFSLANTAEGNLVRARLALAPSATEWSLYWYDASGYGSSFYFLNGGFEYSTAAGSTFVAADMTQFHTFTSYVLAGQVSYFFDNTYLGGGAAITGASDFLLIGDSSASTPTGTGSMRLDYLQIDVDLDGAAPVIAPPNPVPDTAATAGLLAAALAGLAGWRRRR